MLVHHLRKSHYFVVLAAVVMMLFAGTVQTEAQVTGTGYVINASRLNVRTGPGVGFPAFTQLVAGQAVTLVGRNADASWVEIIIYGGSRGWVNSYYISPNINFYSLPITYGGGTAADATVSAYYLNMRSGPGVSFGRVAVLSRGQPLDLVGRTADNRWVQVNAPGVGSGWVNAHYLHVNINIYTLPITGGYTPPPPPPPAASGYVTAYYLNVRYGPSAGYGRFTIISRGTVVTLIGRNYAGSWVQIRIPGGAVGWVNVSYIATGYPIYSLPITG